MGKVYSKNYHIKGLGLIGGQPVSAKIDSALNAALSKVKKKAEDFHIEEPKKKASK